jgi:hypothetical protein
VRVARAQRAVWLSCPYFFEEQNFEVDETESGRIGDVVTAAGKELYLLSTEQGHKPFLFEMPICREGL